jgi:outer membrane receptor protein involved in Fe transport
VVNYELGIKTTLLDGRLSLVGSLYHIDWNDTIISVSDQIDDVVGVSPLSYSYAINGGTAESEGVELEVRIALSPSVRFNIGGDYNWTAEIGSSGDSRYGGVQIEPGNRLANAPKFSLYANVVWDFDLAGFDANARADFYAIDESWNTANNERPAPSYQTLDLRLTAGRGDWRAAVYVRNIFDEEIVYEFNQVGYRFGRPRTIGLQFTYNL